VAATVKMLDFRPRYHDDELDRLASQVAEILGPVFEANGWRWDGEIPSAVDLALTIRRLLATAAEDEQDRGDHRGSDLGQPEQRQRVTSIRRGRYGDAGSKRR
jgi:hypothetical protein